MLSYNAAFGRVRPNAISNALGVLLGVGAVGDGDARDESGRCTRVRAENCSRLQHITAMYLSRMSIARRRRAWQPAARGDDGWQMSAASRAVGVTRTTRIQRFCRCAGSVPVGGTVGEGTRGHAHRNPKIENPTNFCRGGTRMEQRTDVGEFRIWNLLGRTSLGTRLLGCKDLGEIFQNCRESPNMTLPLFSSKRIVL